MLNIWRNNWEIIFIEENKLIFKLSLIPNFPACLSMLASCPPKYGIRKKATEKNHKKEMEISKDPNFKKPLKINQIPKPKTRNELVTLQDKIKKIFINNSQKETSVFSLNDINKSKTIGNAKTSGWKSKILTLKTIG